MMIRVLVTLLAPLKVSKLTLMSLLSMLTTRLFTTDLRMDQSLLEFQFTVTSKTNTLLDKFLTTVPVMMKTSGSILLD